MRTKNIKNNVTRMLDSRKIAYTVVQLPAEKLGAAATAQLLKVPLEVVYKTIVVLRKRRGKPILAVVPGTTDVDLKALARAVGEKKLSLSTQKQAETLTGLQAGGISPLALINRGFQVVLDAAAQDHEAIHISGGQRGLNILLPVRDLVGLTNASIAPISQLIT
jgi:Cys-tRNA(Pro)/Cys-tRNA(Cys) deacylase